jgi:hypothetical protein
MAAAGAGNMFIRHRVRPNNKMEWLMTVYLNSTMAISSPPCLIDKASVFYSAGCGFESRRGRVMCATDMRACVVSHLRNNYQRLVARWARTTSKFKALHDKALRVNYLLHAIERNEIIEKRI